MNNQRSLLRHIADKVEALQALQQTLADHASEVFKLLDPQYTPTKDDPGSWRHGLPVDPTKEPQMEFRKVVRKYKEAASSMCKEHLLLYKRKTGDGYVVTSEDDVFWPETFAKEHLKKVRITSFCATIEIR